MMADTVVLGTDISVKASAVAITFTLGDLKRADLSVPVDVFVVSVGTQADKSSLAIFERIIVVNFSSGQACDENRIGRSGFIRLFCHVICDIFFPVVFPVVIISGAREGLRVFKIKSPACCKNCPQGVVNMPCFCLTKVMAVACKSDDRQAADNGNDTKEFKQRHPAKACFNPAKQFHFSFLPYTCR